MTVADYFFSGRKILVEWKLERYSALNKVSDCCDQMMISISFAERVIMIYQYCT